jgi:glucan phosphoethanolaminetransferase (alkaline phosphatase superfamily)
MKNLQSVLLTVELIIFLLPITPFVLLGSLWIIYIQIADKLDSSPFLSMTLITTSSFLLFSLISIWYIVIQYIRKAETTEFKRELTGFFADGGALFSIICLVALLLANIFPSLSSTTAIKLFSTFAFGSPALIPYFHMFYIKGGLLAKNH